MKKINTDGVPIKMWLNELEESALQQALNLASLPFAFKHIALMPDAHCGYGMPIGGVLAAKGVVVPNAVGVDIGCGMCAMRTDLRNIDRKSLLNITEEVRRRIPLGFSKHKEPQDEKYMPSYDRLPFVVEQEYNNARHQIGSLGGGNHFIEIQKGSDSYIWIMIHSGSRNLGKQVADCYNHMAKDLNKLWKSPIPSKWNLAYFPMDIKEAQEYITEMNYCVDFALANRKLMMERVQEIVMDELHGRVEFHNFINIAHNYAAKEIHFGEELMVHRKGATSAREGEIGIIPGSQGTKSYIVKGLGNPESFQSCSHGAGRKMGRRQAQRSLDLKTEVDRLNQQGILHAIKSPKDLDEAAGAYKDIQEVMHNQKDLVNILIELEPLAVVKG
jgi:tRNA-splicing ligase RtcB